jgi:hypothetical protein
MASLSRNTDQIRLVRAGLAVVGLAVIGNLFGLCDVRQLIGRLPDLCMFHVLTGWDCPGCGMGRALALLTHGEIVASLHQHPFGLPLVVWAAGQTLLPECMLAPIEQSRVVRSNALGVAAIGLIALWWIATKVV